MPKSNKGGSKKDKKVKGKTKDKAKDTTKKAKPSVQDPELIKSLNIVDSRWKCTVVMVILPNKNLFGKLLPQLDGEPDISVITEKSISEPPSKESRSRKGSRKRSKSLGSGKSSEKSKKTTVKANKKTRSPSKSPKLDSMNRNKSLGNEKSSKKSKKTTVKADKKPRSPSKSPKLGSMNRNKSLGSENRSSKSKKTSVKTNKKLRSTSKSTKLSQNKKEELPCTKTCFSLKKRIIGLKESDLQKFFAVQNPEESKKTVKQPVHTGKKQVNAEIDGSINGKQELNTDFIALHRFIILWGFYDPKIPEELVKFMVPLRAIVHVKESDGLSTIRLDRDSIKRIENSNKKVNRKKSVGKKIIKPVNDKISSDYSIFVEEMSNNINDRDYLEVNKDFIFINLTTDNKNIDDFKMNIINLFHKVKESWEKYEQYNKSINVQQIPQIDEKLELGTAELYSTLVSLVPSECINVPVIIHCMLEQVAWWVEEKASSHTSFTDNEDIISNETKKTSDEPLLRHLITRNITPVIVDERDEIKLNTFHLHLPEFNFEEISTKMYTRSPIYNLWKIYPAHKVSRSTWFELHLQKLRNLNSKCYFNQNKHYLHHLHLLLMNTFILNLNFISENLHNDDESSLSENGENSDFVFSIKKNQGIDKHAIIFVEELVNDMLGKIFQQISQRPKSYSQIYHDRESLESVSIESEHSSLSNIPKWYETKIASEEAPTETLLEEKARYNKEKLNRLKSFLLCSDIVGLNEEVTKLQNKATFYDCLPSYDFIEELDYNIMAQTLQNAFHTFTNVNYEYFAPTDTLLLWFNCVFGNYLTTKVSIKAALETPLGFRDFYRFKLKGKSNWIETENLNHVNTPVDSPKELSSQRSDSFLEPTCTVYDLGSSRLEVEETFVHFDSPDSSKVLVKKFSYFDNRKSAFNVALIKNNTTVSYEVDPDIDSKYANVRITFSNGIFANCSFTWKPSDEKNSFEGAGGGKIDNSPLQQTELQNEDYELDCDLSISLPSGLHIEIVSTDSHLGPFYIKQRYLSKGPECNNIWGETYRCYLKNGTIIIFRDDNSVDVLYSNGTKVSCSSMEVVEEPVEIPEEQVTKDDTGTSHKRGSSPKKLKESTLKSKKTKTKKESLTQKKKLKSLIKQKNEESIVSKKTKTKKGSLTQKKKRKSPIKQKNEESIVSKKTKTKKGSLTQKKKRKSPTKQKNEESIVKENTMLADRVKIHEKILKINEHSVLWATGELSNFKNCVEIRKESKHTLRMGFDCLNQELYVQRNDGQSSLFTSKSLTTVFNDGSKITSYVEDDKNLIVDDLTPQYTHKTLKTKQSVEQQSIDDKTKIEDFLFMPEQIEDKQDNNSIDSEDSDLENFVFVDTKYDLEHNNYATVEFSNHEDIIEILLPGLIKIKIDDKKMFTINTDNGDTIFLNEDSLHFQADVLLYSLKPSRSVIKFINSENRPRIISRTLDSFDNEFSIDDRGNANLLRSDAKFDKFDDAYGPPQYPENQHRFVVLKRDLTGYELIHKKQTRSKNFDTHNTDKHRIEVPLIKGNKDLFTLYTQKSIYENKSEEYLMSYKKKTNLPSMMKRKDLLKRKDMPESIWYHKACSLAPDFSESLPEPIQRPKAMVITQKTKIKYNEYDFMSTFYTSLKKYIDSSEQLYNKYRKHFVNDIRKEEVYMEGEQLKQNLFGSKSYYLADNLPAVTIGDDNSLHRYPEITIEEILSSYQIGL